MITLWDVYDKIYHEVSINNKIFKKISFLDFFRVKFSFQVLDFLRVKVEKTDLFNCCWLSSVLNIHRFLIYVLWFVLVVKKNFKQL